MVGMSERIYTHTGRISHRRHTPAKSITRRRSGGGMMIEKEVSWWIVEGRRIADCAHAAISSSHACRGWWCVGVSVICVAALAHQTNASKRAAYHSSRSRLRESGVSYAERGTSLVSRRRVGPSQPELCGVGGILVGEWVSG
jgi:hypothetical protein